MLVELAAAGVSPSAGGASGAAPPVGSHGGESGRVWRVQGGPASWSVGPGRRLREPRGYGGGSLTSTACGAALVMTKAGVVVAGRAACRVRRRARDGKERGMGNSEKRRARRRRRKAR